MRRTARWPLPDTHENKLSRSRLARVLWLSLAGASLVVGAIGIVVPGLPTTPFVLLAAFAAARGSPALHAWLRNHRTFGRMVADWEREGAVGRRAKWVASVTMLASAALMVLVRAPAWATASACTIMALVAAWLWTRPEPGRRA